MLAASSLFRLLCLLCAACFLQVAGPCNRAVAGTIQLVSPGDADSVPAGQVTLLLQVSLDPGQELLGFAMVVDDVPVKTRSIAVSTGNPDLGLHRFQVDLAAGTRRISVIAHTTAGELLSGALTLNVHGPGGEDPLLRPNLYVLAIGVSSYREPSLRLRFPAKDAIDLVAALRRQSGGLYNEVRVRLLVDAAANKADLLDALEWLQRQTTSRDVVVLFLAGHGIRDGATGVYYFLPADAELDAVKRTMLSQDDLRTTLHSLPGKVLVFLDTCFSGQLMRQQQRSPLGVEQFIADLVSADNGVVVFASSSGKQTSQESADWRNGVFTRALIEGLSGNAVLPGRETITISMLDLYVSERVKQLTGGVQTPTLSRPQSGQDFPIALPQALPSSNSQPIPRPPVAPPDNQLQPRPQVPVPWRIQLPSNQPQPRPQISPPRAYVWQPAVVRRRSVKPALLTTGIVAFPVGFIALVAGGIAYAAATFHNTDKTGAVAGGVLMGVGGVAFVASWPLLIIGAR